MPSSYDPSAVTKADLESRLSLLESSLKLELTKQITGLMTGAFLALTYIAFWVLIIVAIAADAKGKG